VPPTLRIGVGAGVPADPSGRLEGALADAFDLAFVRFVNDPPRDLDGLIVSDTHPGVEQFARLGVPVLTYLRPQSREVAPALVELATEPRLDQPFRGCAIEDREAPVGDDIDPIGEEAVLASVRGHPIWCVAGFGRDFRYRVMTRWPTLPSPQCLRDAFTVGRFVDLLPLVHFLARIDRPDPWQRPPIRAAFLVDDPNLHRPHYGFLDFRQLAAQAASHDYHVAFATVPLDVWYADAAAATVFRENPDKLSLLIHGNDHLFKELGRPLAVEQYVRLSAQALRRIRRFEERTGIAVARIMAAPHGQCHENAAVALYRTGFDGLCISRPFPWLPAAPSDRPLAGWFPADHVAGGLPVLPRYSISKDVQDLRFRAWLGQPLVVYGHHTDFSRGYEVLSRVADFVGTLGSVAWNGLREIARTNYWARQMDGTLVVMPFSSCIRVQVPQGVRSILVRTPPVAGRPLGGFVRMGSTVEVSLRVADDGSLVSEEVACVAEGVVDIRLAPIQSVDYRDVQAVRTGIWPYVRRAMTELRDRLQPRYGSLFR